MRIPPTDPTPRAGGSRWAPPAAARLADAIEELLGTDVRLRGAFLVTRGAPSSAAWEAIPFLGLWIGLIREVANRKDREVYAIAVSDGLVYLLRKRSFRRPRLRHAATFDRSALTPLAGAGDEYVELGGTRYWVPIVWTDQARTLSR